VDWLSALDNALISINRPSDKAWAVVDAMERDMGTTLATNDDNRRASDMAKQRAGPPARCLRLRLIDRHLTGSSGHWK